METDMTEAVETDEEFLTRLSQGFVTRDDLPRVVAIALASRGDAVLSDTELLFQCYGAAMVLRTMCKKAELGLGAERAEQLIADIGAAHPEFVGRSALRAALTAQEKTDDMD